MTTRAKDQGGLDAHRENHAHLDGAAAETPPAGGSGLVSAMAAALKPCFGYLDERSREMWAVENIDAIREDAGRDAARLDAVLKPVRAALKFAAAETPPAGGSADVSAMSAALKTCLGYLDERSREARRYEREAADKALRGFCGREAERIDAILKPVRAALEREAGLAAERQKARRRSMDRGMER